MSTPPCSSFRVLPSYCTSDSFKTRTVEPVALMLATESEFVCTKSPKKMADDLAMLLPLSNAVPWL